MLVILLSPVALGLGGMVNITGVSLIALFIWISSLLLAVFLEKWGKPGPADFLLRTLIYHNKKGNPLKKDYGRNHSPYNQ